MKKPLTPKSAVHKHERAMHKGEPLTKMKDGGRVKMAAGGAADRSSGGRGPTGGGPSTGGGRGANRSGGDRSASVTGNRFGAPSKSTARAQFERNMTGAMAGDIANERRRNQAKQDALKRGNKDEIGAMFGLKFKNGGRVKKGNLI